MLDGGLPMTEAKDVAWKSISSFATDDRQKYPPEKITRF